MVGPHSLMGSYCLACPVEVAAVPSRWDKGPPVHKSLSHHFSVLHPLVITFTSICPLGVGIGICHLSVSERSEAESFLNWPVCLMSVSGITTRGTPWASNYATGEGQAGPDATRVLFFPLVLLEGSSLRAMWPAPLLRSLYLLSFCSLVDY